MVATCSRIYVACLASYNAGTLHGRWIDADQDADDIREEIAAMLRESPYPNVTVDCEECDGDSRAGCSFCKGTGQVPSAEEYAIHDYEGFEGIKIGEHEDIDTVAELVQAIDQRGEAFAAWWNNENRDDVDMDAFLDAYAGTYKSEEEYAEEFVEECYADILKSLPDFIRYHIDYEGIARDFQLGGDVWYHHGDEGVHVFRNV